MKCNTSRPKNKSLADELAELRELDATALKQRWRVLYRSKHRKVCGRFTVRDRKRLQLHPTGLILDFEFIEQPRLAGARFRHRRQDLPMSRPARRPA